MQKNAFYFGKKLIVFLLSILLLSLLVFYIARLTPADPLVSYYGERAEKMSVEEKEAAREKLGLNDPIYVQYIRWLRSALRGDFGISYQYKQPVTEVFAGRIGNTLLLGGISCLLTFSLALVLGVLCAWFEDRWVDRLLCKAGTLVSCIPEFWLSLVLILLFSVTLRWLPSGGAYSVGNSADIADRLRHLILPVTVVVAGHLWYYAYLIRNKLLEEFRADYVELGKAMGFRKSQILWRRCLPNAVPTYITMIAVSAPHILGGTYIVETVFGYPGIGKLAYESARYGDYNLLMVLCLFTGALVMFSSFLGNLLSERIDPRIRADAQEEVAAD